MKFNSRASRTLESRASELRISGLRSTTSIDSEPVSPTPPEAPQPNKGQLLLSMMEDIQKEMKASREEIVVLRNEFRDVAEQQGVQHKIFDALHTELGDYKNDFVSARMKPMLSAMLFLYDAISDFKGELDAYVDPPDWLGERVLKKELIKMNLSYFQEQFDEVLRMCELQPIAPEMGEVAEPKVQNIVSTETTEDVDLNNHIQKVVRIGWTQGEKIFRPADVIIWKTAA
ncbi:nucleotide exchange factor GrpE [bacterium]|nr:MAG: nucleotide exchange factor GrpE [bacterium]